MNMRPQLNLPQNDKRVNNVGYSEVSKCRLPQTQGGGTEHLSLCFHVLLTWRKEVLWLITEAR